MSKELIERLQREMENKGMKPKTLSLAAGVNETYIRDLLEGKAKEPSVFKLIAICKVLGVHPGRLIPDLGFSDEMLSMWEGINSMPDNTKKHFMGMAEEYISQKKP